MSAQLACPQCRAALKLPDTLAPGQMVACPSCRLRFAPTAPTPPATTPVGLTSILVVAALFVGVGGGAFGWYWFADKNPQPAPVQVADKAPEGSTSLETSPPTGQSSASDSNGNSTQQPVIIEPKTTSKQVQPVAPKVKSLDDLPDVPPVPSKKPSPKSYVETKKSKGEDGPITETPMPATKPPANVGVNPAVNAAVKPPVEVAQKLVFPPSPRQTEINAAIEKGIAFLKGAQLPSGGWLNPMDPNSPTPGKYEVGCAAICGLTLLEAQVPANDPTVQRAANFVRNKPLTDRMHRNYEMSCVLLFLDRLGDPKDKALIQALALTLVAGQNARGGWTYDSPDLNGFDRQQLLAFLDATRLPSSEPVGGAGKQSLEDSQKGKAEKGEPSKQGKGTAKSKSRVPAYQSLSRTLQSIPLVHLHYFPKTAPPAQAAPPMVPGPGVGLNLPVPQGPGGLMMMMGGDDNSNTQFAMLALWAARRHGVPTERCFLAVGSRFASTQIQDGGWSYSSGGLAIVQTSLPTMTCVGLLGMAMGHAVLPAKKDANDTKLPEDPNIARALQRLAENIDTQSMINFYLLWSVERVGMLYNLPTIGNRDWYRIGSDMLLDKQMPDGSWSTQGFIGTNKLLDTSFALMFLKRSNLVQDLSERLPLRMAITDPAAKQ